MTVDERWAKHVTDARTGRGWKLHNAIRKYGPEAFTVKAVMYANDQAELNYLERLVIDAFMSVTRVSGYNLTTGGEGGKLSEETRAKISRALMGRPCSAETRTKIGKPCSAEKRAKIGAANRVALKGRTWSADALAKRSATNKGRKRSAETKAKMSAAQKGITNRALTDEQVEEMVALFVPRQQSHRGNSAELAAKYGVHVHTIRTTVKRYKKHKGMMNHG